MNELVNYINDRVNRFIKRSDILNATPATVISVEDGNWATISILSNGSIYRLKNLSGSPLAEGQSCQVYYKKNLSQNNAYIGAVNSEIQPSLSQIVSFETINNLGVRSGEKYKISEVSFICHSLDKCYFSFSSSIKGVVDNDIILYLYVDNVETGIVFTQTLSIDHSENVSFYMPIEIQATGKHTITIKADGQCDVLNVASYVYGVNLTKPDSRLPDDYQEVEYLESSGTQYIDTGWRYDIGDTSQNQTNYNIQCKCSCSDNYSVFGNKDCFNLTGASGFMKFRGYTYYSGDVVRTDVPIGNTPVKWQYNNEVLYADGVQKGELSRGHGSGGGQPIYLFCRYSGYWGEEVEDMGGTVRIYNFSVSENPAGSPDRVTPIVDLWPCVRKSDGKPGMYDLITETFYTNQGTGEFIIP